MIPSYPYLRSSLGLLLRRESVLLSLLAVPLGIMCGYVAVLLFGTIRFLGNLFFYHQISFNPYSLIHNPLGWNVILIPVAGGVLVGLVVFFFAKEAKGHGVPEVMEALILHEGRIRPRVVVGKAVASALCIASGGSTGREGPVIQIGSALGSTIGQWLKLRPAVMRILVGCGAAASVAATFNTPIAGVVFAFEVLLFEFKTRSFVPLVIATVFATIISRHHLGDQPAFRVPAYSFVNPVEIGFYLVLGVLAGVLAVLIIKSLYGLEHFFDRLKMPEFLKPALGGLGVGALGIFLPQVLGIGYDSVEAALNGKLILGLLVLLVVFKILALSLTLGSGGSGGIFAPNLFIGAMLGGAFGTVIHAWFPTMTATSGAYALVGMAAVFAGVSRATLTAIIILFEMTMDYHIILPLMFACVVADGVAFMLSRETIYTKKLANRGLFVNFDMEVNPLELSLVGQHMSQDLRTVEGNEPARKVWDLLLETGHHGFPVINRKDQLIGMITEAELHAHSPGELNMTPVKDVMASKLIVTYSDENLQRALAKMMLHRVDHLPVVDRKNPKQLVGILTRTDIMVVMSAARE
jgi:CIC family chloride channel protein